MDEIREAVTQNFKDWACSFSGCDGGNPKRSIWLCGIEWGFGKEKGDKQDEYVQKLRKYYQEELTKEILEGACAPEEKLYDMKAHSKYQFGLKLAKLYSVIQGHKAEEYREVVNRCTGSEIFKMNLYPIAFPNEDDALWDKYGLAKITGLPSKYVYRTWCFLNRFPFISKEVIKYEPNIIIATGITYLTDFVVCFAGQRGVEDIHKETITPKAEANKSKRSFYWTRINQKTLLVVIPFFGGANGLNSDYLLQQFGERIKHLINN